MIKSGCLFDKMRFKKLFFFLLALLLTLGSFSQNLITNGDFESGGPGTGFDVNGAGYVNITPPPPLSGTSAPGNYAFLTNPQPMNTAFFLSFGDHTSGTGRMMVIDGNTTGGAQRFWRLGNTGGGVCGLTVGATYTFSYWIRSASSTVTGVSTQADIGIQVNNAAGLTLTGGSTLAPLPAAGWQKVTYTFQPTNACINIELWNNNTNPVGNDFAVDDFELLPPPTPLSISYSISNVTCPGANDGAIVVYGIGGIKPYNSYSLTGSATQTNTNGIFTGLAPGTYNISITDDNSATASVTGLIITQPANIDISPTFAQICTGIPVTLTASGAPTYNWTAAPADPTLVTPNNPSITVTPVVTTIYTVTSNTSSTRELLFNGDFSLGNVGFSTDYQYLNPTNPSGAQRAYGIVTNSQAWWNTFASCTGRGGTGNMMVADGSTFNLGNDRVWCQTIPVKTGQNYTFSYWVQSLTSNNLANLEVTINGVSVGTALAPAATCTWQQRTYVWNSGASTTAQICIYDRVTQTSGNDFALDDLSFTTSVTCNLSASVTVVVDGSTAVTGFSYTSPVCADAANLTPVTVPGFTTGGTFSSIAGLSINPSTGVINVGASTPGIYTVTYTVAPSGCNSGGSSNTTVTINNLPVLGAAIITQPTCVTTTGTITVTNPAGSNFEYNINGSAFQSSPAFSGLIPGSYIVRVRNVSTGCISLPTSPILPIIINPVPLPPAAPTASVTVQPTCSVPTGTIVVTAPVGANLEYSINGTTYQSSTTFTGLVPNVYNVRVRNSLTGCVSTLTPVTVNPVPAIPATPTASVTIQPTCSVPTGTIVVTAPVGANLEYSVNGTTYQSSTTFTGLVPNVYNVTVRNSSTGCVSNSTAVTVNPVPTIPTAPTASVTIQPTCNVPTGTIVVSAPVGANLEYSVNGTTYQSSPTFTGVAPGTYNVRVRNTVSFCVSPQAQVTVNPVPAAPPAATSFIDIFPNCVSNLTVIRVTAPIGPLLRYSINGGAFQAAPVFSTNLGPGTYVIRVQNSADGCISAPASITVPPPVVPAAPAASVTVQPTCAVATGTIVITSPVGATLQYSINGVNYQSSPTFTGVAPGTYNVTVRNTANFCISAPTSVTVNSAPAGLAAPLASVLQPTCTVATGAINVTTPLGLNFEYSIDGTSYQSNPSFINLVPGLYNVTVRSTSTGCVSSSTPVKIDIAPVSPNPPVVSSPVNYCLNESTVPLTANGTNLLWYTTATGGTGSTSAPRPSSSAEGNTTYYVSQTANGCESQRAIIIVSVKPLPIANAGFDKKIFPGQPVQLNGTTNSVTNTAFWTPNVNITNANTFTPTVAPVFSLNYTLTVTSADGCTAKDIANVVVLKEPIIPNVFSPNNDGMNDRWVIRNLDLYDNIRVEIFNRYGERVYESRSYNSSNAWDGTYKGNPLPVGAYFYVIQLNNGKEPLKGSISIVR
jgi:large repetitive protein